MWALLLFSVLLVPLLSSTLQVLRLVAKRVVPRGSNLILALLVVAFATADLIYIVSFYVFVLWLILLIPPLSPLVVLSL